MNQCDEMLKTIVDQFWVASDSEVDLDGVVEIVIRSQTRKFEKEDFKKDWPDLYKNILR
jgi:hypothetical protein